MQYEKLLTTIEEIKIFSDPFRLKILFSFDGINTPQTVKQVADKLGEVPAKVHYHVKELEKIGVLEIVEKKEKSGIVEKYYLPTAENFKIDKSIQALEGSRENADVIRSSMINDIVVEFNNHLKHPSRSIDDIADIKYGTVYLTRDEIEEFNRLYQDFIDGKTKREGTVPYRHAVLIFRKYDE